MCVYDDNFTDNTSDGYVIGIIKNSNSNSTSNNIKLHNKDIFHQYRDLFELLVRYHTMREKLNHLIKFKGGDGKEVTITEDLFREKFGDQILQRFINACQKKHNEARRMVKTNNKELEAEIRRRYMKIIKKHQTEIKTFTYQEIDESIDEKSLSEKELLELSLKKEEIKLRKKQYDNKIKEQKEEITKFEKGINKYKEDNTYYLVEFPQIRTRLSELSKNIELNKIHNRKARVPKNAQKKVPCKFLD